MEDPVRHIVTVELMLVVEGSAEEAQAIGDRFQDLLLENTDDMYCGDPECCPGPPPPRPYLTSGTAFSTVMTEDEYGKTLEDS